MTVKKLVCIAVLCGAIAALVGCGGGGGGAAPGTSRSFSTRTADAELSLTVDAAGRFTLYARDSATIPAGVSAQGNTAPDGRFYTKALSGDTEFTGTAPSSGGTATCTISRSGATLVSLQAARIAQANSTSGIAGTYSASAGGVGILMSVDQAGSGTLYAVTPAATGGGAIAVDSSGSLVGAGGAIAGQLLSAGGSFSLRLDRLAGTTVNQTYGLTRSSKAKWTFLVYLNGANDLQTYGPLNVNQMEKVGSTADVNIVVQWKQASCASCGSPQWTGTRRYYIKRDYDTNTVTSDIVQDMGTSVDMGNWNTLRSFIAWGQQTYPADHYAVVIWNHGAGWRPTRAPGKPAVLPLSVSIDDDSRSEIQTWELPQALDVTPNVDMVVFDASLMQMLEVAAEIQHQCAYIVGSEESPPGEGYVYNSFLTDLTATPTMTPAQFGTAIVQRTIQDYGTGGNNTQSLIDTSRIPALTTALDTFAAEMTAHVADDRSTFYSARVNADSYAYPENKDLWHYADLVRSGATTPSVVSSASAVQSAIASAVLSEAHGTFHSHSHGIAIYVPAPASYLTSYANLALAKTTRWDTWLQAQPATP